MQPIEVYLKLTDKNPLMLIPNQSATKRLRNSQSRGTQAEAPIRL